MEIISKDYILKKPEWERSIVIRINKYGERRDIESLFQYEDAAILGLKTQKITNASWDLLLKNETRLKQFKNGYKSVPFKVIDLIISYDMYYTNKQGGESISRGIMRGLTRV